MQPKDLATVRVSNLSPDLKKKKELHNFLDRRNVNATSNISLCPHGSAKDSPLVATVTFHPQSSAKRGLGSERESTGRSQCQHRTRFHGSYGTGGTDRSRA